MIRSVNYWGGVTARVDENGTWSVRYGRTVTSGLTTDDAAERIARLTTFPGIGHVTSVDDVLATLARTMAEVTTTDTTALAARVASVMLATGDLAPAARTMPREAFGQWVTLQGVDEWDAAYIVGAAMARHDWPHPQDDPDVPASLDAYMAEVFPTVGEDDGQRADWRWSDAYESGYVDESGRLADGVAGDTLADTHDGIVASRADFGAYDEDDYSRPAIGAVAQFLPGATLDNTGGGALALVLRSEARAVVLDPDVTAVHTYSRDGWDGADPVEPFATVSIPDGATGHDVVRMMLDAATPQASSNLVQVVRDLRNTRAAAAARSQTLWGI
jgi:hypothetical protein